MTKHTDTGRRTAVSLIEKIARDIADALGDNFDYAFNSKPEWTAARGETKAGFRDVNQPFKSCYLDAAQAALTAIMGEGDGVQQCDRDAAKSLLGRDDAGPSWWSIDSGNADSDPMVQAFTRHRSTAAAAKRARIVAWLRGASDGYDNPSLLAIADAIERGEV